jgi:hypothetical protein
MNRVRLEDAKVVQRNSSQKMILTDIIYIHAEKETKVLE